MKNDDWGWPGRVRSTGRVAKRQEAPPFGFNGKIRFQFAIRANVPAM